MWATPAFTPPPLLPVPVLVAVARLLPDEVVEPCKQARPPRPSWVDNFSRASAHTSLIRHTVCVVRMQLLVRLFLHVAEVYRRSHTYTKTCDVSTPCTRRYHCTHWRCYNNTQSGCCIIIVDKIRSLLDKRWWKGGPVTLVLFGRREGWHAEKTMELVEGKFRHAVVKTWTRDAGARLALDITLHYTTLHRSFEF